MFKLVNRDADSLYANIAEYGNGSSAAFKRGEPVKLATDGDVETVYGATNESKIFGIVVRDCKSTEKVQVLRVDPTMVFETQATAATYLANAVPGLRVYLADTSSHGNGKVVLAESSITENTSTHAKYYGAVIDELPADIYHVRVRFEA